MRPTLLAAARITARTAWLLFALSFASRAQAECKVCAKDADCGHGYVCHEDEIGQLTCMLGLCDSEADCPPDILCVPPREPRCEPPRKCTADAERGQCMPRWAVPCTTDADCGPERACKELQQCGCWWADETPDEPCGCRGEGVFRCESIPSDCEFDAPDGEQCPMGWWCGQYSPIRSVCLQPWERDGGSCEVVQDPPVHRCVPPCTGPLLQSYREFSIPDEGGSGSGSEAGTGGAGGTGGGGGSGDGGRSESSHEPMDAGASPDGGAAASSASDDCGCTTPGSSGRAHTPLTAGALALLVALVLRRRAR